MSVKVDLDQLADALADFTFAYLITVGDDYRAHTVAVEPVSPTACSTSGPSGGHTRRNLAAARRRHPRLAAEGPGGYTLIVDGHGQVTATIPRASCPPRRAAPQGGAGCAATATGCMHDCVPLEGVESRRRHEKARLASEPGLS